MSASRLFYRCRNSSISQIIFLGLNGKKPTKSIRITFVGYYPGKNLGDILDEMVTESAVAVQAVDDLLKETE